MRILFHPYIIFVFPVIVYLPMSQYARRKAISIGWLTVEFIFPFGESK